MVRHPASGGSPRHQIRPSTTKEQSARFHRLQSRSSQFLGVTRLLFGSHLNLENCLEAVPESARAEGLVGKPLRDHRAFRTRSASEGRGKSRAYQRSLFGLASGCNPLRNCQEQVHRLAFSQLTGGFGSCRAVNFRSGRSLTLQSNLRPKLVRAVVALFLLSCNRTRYLSPCSSQRIHFGDDISRDELSPRVQMLAGKIASRLLQLP